MTFPGAVFVLVAGATMALSGFLLFQVQPMMARYILPWFGGSATTWTVCMLFFQLTLLLGYFYAHIFTRPFKPRTQTILHVALILAALIVLPITPTDNLKPLDADNPTTKILVLLTLCVGLPYLVLSTTTPLIQSWLASVGSSTPSRLFALSNFGSFLGLVSYPFIVDLYLPTDSQTQWWSVAFALYAMLMIGFGLMVFFNRGNETTTTATPAPTNAAHSAPGDFALWFTLSAFGSAALLAVTNDITSYVSVNPFLWILPLCIYLLSFVVTFAWPNFYRPGLFGLIYAGVLLFDFFTATDFGIENAFAAIGVGVACFAVCCMVCQGELARRQPPPQGLTYFYLALAAGGAAGGAFVSLLAPVIFPDYWELPIALIGTGILHLALNWKDLRDAGSQFAPHTTIAAALALSTALALYSEIFEGADMLDRHRNFYGVLKVDEVDAESPQLHRFIMRQAGENQGEQFADPARASVVPCDFGPDSGIGIAIRNLQAKNPSGIRVGIIGLGAGMMVSYGRPQDKFHYYELNPKVTDFAREHFTYLDHATSTVEISHGDGRLALERELKTKGPQNFDLLLMDAFRGNAPPAHLMTKEAFEIYFRHLRDGGVLAVTSHSDYYDASSLFRGMADLLRTEIGWIPTKRTAECQFKLGFALFTRDKQFFAADKIKARLGAWEDNGTHKTVWTDQSSSLMSLMVWGR
jgi:hypothetical protein